MTNERVNLNLKLIEEKINNKFLELKCNFESKNEEISLKLEEINNRIEKLNQKNQPLIPLKEKIELSLHKNNIKAKEDNKNILEIIIKQLQRFETECINKINLLENKLEEIKKDNDIIKERIKKKDNEFTIIKIRFGEMLNFIRDKNFWKKYTLKIIEQSNLRNQKIRKNIDKEYNTNKISDIYAPFNYYKHFGVEENKNFVDESMNTTHHKEPKKNDLTEVNSISINEQIDDLKENPKYKTPNNIANISIIKSFRELNSKFLQNLKQQNNSSLLNNTNYKKVPKNIYIKNKEQNTSNSEDTHDNLINAINSNISLALNDNKINSKTKRKEKAKINEYFMHANFMNKNKNDSNNLSEAYILKESKKIKKLTLAKSEQKYYQILPISIKNNLRKSRNNSLKRINIISNKDLRQGNIEDLLYSKIKQDKIGHISSFNYSPPNSGENININNNTNDKRSFPFILRDKKNN